MEEKEKDNKTMIDTDLKVIVDEIYASVSGVKYLELEGRIGLCDPSTGTFNSDISEHHFNTIKDMLKSCNKWESVIVSNSRDYFNKTMRLTVDQQTKSETLVVKKKVKVFTFVTGESSMFDIRVSVSSETPPTPSRKFPVKRERLMYRDKERESFVLVEQGTRFSFDLTRVKTCSDPVKHPEDIVVSHEYEIEIKNEVTECSVHSMLLKTIDGVFACSGRIPTDKLPLPLESFSMSALRK